MKKCWTTWKMPSLELMLELTQRLLLSVVSKKRVAKDKYINTNELNGILQEEIENILVDASTDLHRNFDIPAGKKPYVILVVGVNGVGKTTTIGKLAYNYKQAGRSVVLGAADTFRAAAVDQLTIWSERVGVPIVKQSMGSDPSAVAFDAVQSAVAKTPMSLLSIPPADYITKHI